MKQLRCFECGTLSENWTLKKSTREYVDDGYSFSLDVETPYCPQCGAQLYDREIEQKIRSKAHQLMMEQVNDSAIEWPRIPTCDLKK